MPLQPPDNHPAIIEALTKLVGAAMAVVLALVSTLYWLLRSTDAKQQDQLDEGADQFTKNAVDIAKHELTIATYREAFEKDITSIRLLVVSLQKELDEFEIKRMKDHEAFIILQDQHDHNKHEKKEDK